MFPPCCYFNILGVLLAPLKPVPGTDLLCHLGAPGAALALGVALGTSSCSLVPRHCCACTL